MKKSTLPFFLSLLILMVGMNSCDYSRRPISTKVECTGSCNPTIKGTECALNQAAGSTVYCSCAGCKMTITTNDRGKISTIHPTDTAGYSVEFLAEFKKSMEEKFPDKPYLINSVEINNLGNNFSELYSYRFPGDEQGTILFASIISGGKKTVTEIDCTGTCGCKEIFNLNSGTASCSCADCTMTVTSTTK